MLNKIQQNIVSSSKADKARFAVIAGFSLAIGMVSWMLLPNGGLDMREDILPSLWNWRYPWEEGMPLFPWAILVLMPLRILSPQGATALINGLSTLLVALLIKRFGGDILFTIPIMLSPIGYRLLTTGQTDAIVAAAILLPAGFDLLLFWKPQVLLHIFWIRVFEHPKTYFISGIALLAASFVVWGFWLEDVWEFGRTQLIDGWWNFSLWPYGIPVGLLMIYLSFKKKDAGYGLIASPLLFPYVNGPSYIGLLAVAAAKWPRFFSALFLILFLYILLLIFAPGLHLPQIY